MSAADLIAALGAVVPGAEYEALEAVDSDVTPVLLVPAAHLFETCRALQSAPGLEFRAFSDVTATDYYPQREPRFEIVYHLVSPHRRARVRLKVRVGKDEPMASVTPIWAGAAWMEREVYDLFGIVFEGHPDLRRLMMPDDWEGHPLRKDYPVQLRKDATTYMPLQVSEEEFRANLERDRQIRPRPH
ncbi:MAG: NADH-quinone oxidoreductase subunit C [Vicinamibacterales bacterium]